MTLYRYAIFDDGMRQLMNEAAVCIVGQDGTRSWRRACELRVGMRVSMHDPTHPRRSREVVAVEPLPAPPERVSESRAPEHVSTLWERLAAV